MSKYIIIDAEAIQQRIEELKKYCVERKSSPAEFATFNHTILELKEILSQSTPLIPEIEKAFDEAFEICITYRDYKNLENNKQDYISNLKLDI